MIYCISCERYPKDGRVIPYGSEFPIDTVRVKLISKALPNNLNLTGADVEDLADDAKFSVGSLLYVVEGNNGSETYVYVDGSFELWDSSIPIEY